MATYNDTFTEAANTNLESHTPDSGGSWSEVVDTAGTLVVSVVGATDNLGISSGANSQRVIHTVSWTPTSNQYDVSATYVTEGGADDPVWLIARYTDTTHFYAGGWYLSSANPDMKIVLCNGASNGTVLVSSNSAPATTNVVKFEIRNAAKKLYLAGVETCSNADDTLTGTGVCGIGWGNIDSAVATDDAAAAGLRIDDFTLTDATAAQTSLPPVPSQSIRFTRSR